MSAAADGRFDYGVWSRLLAEVVTPDGKVDYDRLASRRTQLDGFVAELGGASPESHPERFPGDDDPTTRRMLESILAVEEEHADDLATLLATLDPTKKA